ncbi:hypothetical protein PGT21_018566 [Puccinia graminis f. sp. tritici]|uniref:Uncharacterized protein n=1 Tax=Puccinia graminis f. sp. tritici TaxID=56615 RepID=A0A5B0Q2Z1_PUCGR|nr:hypothetical protein PGT21_018566 [Puccinia graminis f. sp. tritici]KAA1124631.1 hypothetical protein PGTUg99_024825 [Puccinia graminis f. sp. tritici]
MDETCNTEAEIEPSQMFWKYYSSQALKWIPTKVSQKASLGAHALSKQLLQSEMKPPLKKSLQAMHDSNGILIPFTYNLLLKGLSIGNWRRIKEVWEIFWGYWVQLQNDTSDQEILRSFVWISDYISETANPMLFESYWNNKTQSSHIISTNCHAAMIRMLSAGKLFHMQLTPDVFKACKGIVKSCLHENSIIHLKDLNPFKQLEIHHFVLEKFREISLSITSKVPPEILSCFQNLYERRGSSSYTEYMTNIMFHGKKITGYRLRKKLPKGFALRFDEILAEEKTSGSYIGYSPKEIKQHNFPEVFIQKMERYVGKPEQNTHGEYKFLPARIREFLFEIDDQENR